MPVTVGAISVAIGAGVIDPAWAPTVNTGLIIVLAIIHGREATKRRALQRDVRDAKRKAGADRRDPTHHDTGDRRRYTD